MLVTLRGQRVNTLTKHHFEWQLLVVNVILTAFALVSLVSLLIINSSTYCNFLYLFGKDVNVPQMWMWLDIQFQNLNICWCSLCGSWDVKIMKNNFRGWFRCHCCEWMIWTGVRFFNTFRVTFVSINMHFFLPGPCPAASHCHTHRWYHFGHVWEAEMWYRTWLHYPLPCNICVLCS